MTATWHRILERVGNPLEWRLLDKALIIQAVVLPGMIGSLLRAEYLATHPEVEPYYDRVAMHLLVRLIFGFLVVTFGLVAVGIRLRRYDGPHRVYVHIMNQTWWLTYAVLTYLHGLATTPLWAIFPVLGLFCLLLFDPWLTAAGAVPCLLIIYATTVAERIGVLPYAPIFRDWPMVNGRIADPWL